MTDEFVSVRSMVDDIVAGTGGSQVLIDDRSGNPIELFQPATASPSG